jgi:hypothetical protein
MSHFPQPKSNRRSPRIKLEGSVPAAVKLMDGRRAKAKLATVSITGGMLVLGQPLAEGDFVEIEFRTPSGPVQGMAEMMPASKAAASALQGFRFVALPDVAHQNLRRAVQSFTDRTFLGLREADASRGWVI